MPALHWIGKEKIVNHHRDVPYRILEKKYTYTSTKDVADKVEMQQDASLRPENKIIHGDNLEALKSLLPEYAGKIKCIYIDPPYNTGNENWVYNDNVNDPRIRKWLTGVVGKEGEDLSRHDKWLCMMYPRLALLHQLLAEDGVILISIDENAYSSLHLIMIEIFGRQNELGTIIWDKLNPKGDSTKISYQHESILVFSKSIDKTFEFRKIKKNAQRILEKAKALYKKIGKNYIPDDLKEVVKKYNLDKGILKENEAIYSIEQMNLEFKNWMKGQSFSGGELAYNNIDEQGNVFRPVSMAWPNKDRAPDEYFIPLVHPITKKKCPLPSRGWRYPEKTMLDLLSKNEVLFGVDESTIPNRKYLLNENLFEKVNSVLKYGGSDDDFQKEIGIKLEHAKPSEFITDLISYFSLPDSIILDSFAGSGTTAHAVLNLNKQDGGNRKFILIEMEDYAEKITAERVKRVIEGYGEGNAKTDGTGGSFSFYTLGEPVFRGEELNPDLSIEKLKDYVFLVETGKQRESKPQKENPAYLGVHENRAYYFHYDGKNTQNLDFAFLKSIQTKVDAYIIYADACLLSETFLQEKNIYFRKIPTDILRV